MYSKERKERKKFDKNMSDKKVEKGTKVRILRKESYCYNQICVVISVSRKKLIDVLFLLFNKNYFATEIRCVLKIQNSIMSFLSLIFNNKKIENIFYNI